MLLVAWQHHWIAGVSRSQSFAPLSALTRVSSVVGSEDLLVAPQPVADMLNLGSSYFFFAFAVRNGPRSCSCVIQPDRCLCRLMLLRKAGLGKLLL